MAIMCSKKWWLHSRNEKTVYLVNGPNADSDVRRLKAEIVTILLSAWKCAHEVGKKTLCDSDSRACEERASLGDYHKPFDLRKDTLATTDCFMPLRVKSRESRMLGFRLRH